MHIGPAQFLAYGEDALTYYALSSRLDEVLFQLKDRSSPDRTLAIYRPSFGRGVGAHRSKRYATFGEFDAILASPEAVYLIESKWHHSSEVKGGTIILRERQVARHDIFRWYRANWKSHSEGDWDAFAETHQKEFRKVFRTGRLAPTKSRLRKNLEFVLSRVEAYGRKTEDVVLFIGLGGTRPPKYVVPDGFRLVTLSYRGLKGTGFFDMLRE
jgi:hypothetical protein